MSSLYVSVVRFQCLLLARLQLQTINRCIEFVIREGPLFEAIIMGRETENPQYKFLYDNTCAEHVYYRWKLFSMLHGDTVSRWNTDRFRMFRGGSIWEPPKLNPYANNPVAMSRRIAEEARAKGLLSDSQRRRFESQLRHMTPERRSVGEMMVWCLDHADSADEICNCITESLSNIATRLSSKIARLYLVCDLLHNGSARVSRASKFRNCIHEKLPEIFDHLNKTLVAQQQNQNKNQPLIEAFKQRVLRVLTAWEESSVYQLEFLIALQTTFLGLTLQPPEPVQTVPEAASPTAAASSGLQPSQSELDDVDGAPLSDSDNSDVDGVPLDGALLLKKAAAASVTAPLSKGQSTDQVEDEEDVDGVPLEESAPVPATPAVPASSSSAGAFVPSRWETVDPDDVAAGVVTTSKWDQLTSVSAGDDPPEDQTPPDPEEDVDGVPMNEGPAGSELTEAMSPESCSVVAEDRRQKLREVELKAMAYQDDLESGQRQVKSGYTLLEQVNHYRSKLVKKMDRQIAEGRKRRSNHQHRYSSESRDPATPGDHAAVTDLTGGSPSSASSYPLSAAAGSGSVGGSSGSRSRRRSRSKSSDCDRGKRSRRRSRSRSSSRRRRRSRSPAMTSSSSNSRRSRSPHHRSRSPASYRSHSRSPSRKSSRRKSRR